MKNISGFLILSYFLFASGARAESCAKLKHYQFEKKSWSHSEWKSEVTKTLDFAKLCSSDEPALQMEPELGFALSILDGKTLLELYSHKRTYVVASAEALSTRAF